MLFSMTNAVPPCGFTAHNLFIVDAKLRINVDLAMSLIKIFMRVFVN